MIQDPKPKSNPELGMYKFATAATWTEMILWTLLSGTGLAWQSSSLLTTVAVPLCQRELETSDPSFGEAKSQKWKIRDAAAECHNVTGEQSQRKQSSSCLSCIHGDPEAAGICHPAVTTQPQVTGRWSSAGREGPAGVSAGSGEGTGDCETAEPHLDLLEMAQHCQQFSSCTWQPSHASDKQLSTDPGWRDHSWQCQGLSQGHPLPMGVFPLVTANPCTGGTGIDHQLFQESHY